MRLFGFHIALIPLEKVWIQLFSLQLWVNSRTNWAPYPWYGNQSRRLCIQPSYTQLKNWPCVTSSSEGETKRTLIDFSSIHNWLVINNFLNFIFIDYKDNLKKITKPFESHVLIQNWFFVYLYKNQQILFGVIAEMRFFFIKLLRNVHLRNTLNLKMFTICLTMFKLSNV